MLNNLQVLRAIAAGLVVIAHLSGLNTPLLGQPLTFGIDGVDLFFVISGFVMVYTTSSRPVTPRQFITNRLIRIVPLYWALTLLVFAIAVVAPSLLKATGTDPVELIKSLLFIAFAKSNGRVQPVLFPGWTLNYEMFFYAVFALGLTIRSVRVRVWGVSALFAALVAAGAIVPPGHPVAAFYTSDLMLEFVYGMLIGLAQPRIAARPPRPALCMLLLVAGFALLAIPSALVGQVPMRALSVGLPAASIVFAMVGLEAGGRSLRSPALLLVGAASYSLYLAHVFPLTVIEQVAARHGLDHGWIVLPLFLFAGAVAVGTGILLHLLFERPIDRWLRHRLRSAREPARQGDAAALWPWRRGRARTGG